MANDTITVAIPADLAEDVASAIDHLADWFRRDTGHSTEGIALLRANTDRLDAIAEDIRTGKERPHGWRNHTRHTD